MTVPLLTLDSVTGANGSLTSISASEFDPQPHWKT